MPITCTVCAHESRSVIDRILSEGTGSFRNTGARFGLSYTAIQRHMANHLRPALVQRLGTEALATAQDKARQETRHASRWVERLDQAHEASVRGRVRCESSKDPEVWPQSARFIVADLKAIELGLRSDGVIEGGRGDTTTITQNVLVLPMPQPEEDTELTTSESVLCIDTAALS